jgi:hypothetical protein
MTMGRRMISKQCGNNIIENAKFSEDPVGDDRFSFETGSSG